MRLVLVGSPRYLAKRGTPKSPQDLRKHDLIGFQAGGSVIAWRFQRGGQPVSIAPNGRLHSNSVDAIRDAAIAGLGLAQSTEVFARDDLTRKRLTVLLSDFEAPPRVVYALYTRDKAALPKVRVFLDFLKSALNKAAARN